MPNRLLCERPRPAWLRSSALSGGGAGIVRLRLRGSEVATGGEDMHFLTRPLVKAKAPGALHARSGGHEPSEMAGFQDCIESNLFASVLCNSDLQNDRARQKQRDIIATGRQYPAHITTTNPHTRTLDSFAPTYRREIAPFLLLGMLEDPLKKNERLWGTNMILLLSVSYAPFAIAFSVQTRFTTIQALFFKSSLRAGANFRPQYCFLVVKFSFQSKSLIHTASPSMTVMMFCNRERKTAREYLKREKLRNLSNSPGQILLFQCSYYPTCDGEPRPVQRDVNHLK
ncbi:hypothetical protein N431DRAFT_122588 [Stipitochalara longipes BDJ]|nr:hypothetical protein N431DRAFT_122588 [Stipitochalara longipes BDJ]